MNPLLIALNPWSWAYMLMASQFYYGGKLCDQIDRLIPAELERRIREAIRKTHGAS